MADHLMVAPVVLPLVAGAAMLLLDGERRRKIKAAIDVASTFALVAIAVALLGMSDAAPAGVAGVYRLGDWPAPFGIVLVVDRLSALMLLLTSILASAAVVFSLARWHRAGAHFHPLFQFLLMGLNGAFLTGDLFNLFVFFELLLAASYGLALHGSGAPRVKAGLHYVVVNLAASLLFLVGVSLIYGVSGTLNMADLATRIPDIASPDRALLEAGAGILGIAFLLKAGIWPLCFWLPTTYAAASPPVASVFAIMTKVGAYIVLRLWLLLFGGDAGASARFGGEWLLFGGMATVAFGAIGTLASQDMARLAAFSVLVSSGTVLAATGEAYGEGDEGVDGEDEVGTAIPATMGILGLAFIGCALVIAGLPPLSGFVAKFALLAAALTPSGMPQGGPVPAVSWALLVALILSGLAALVAMTRAGIRAFWASPARAVPRVRVIEIAPVAFLLILCAVQTIQAGPVMRFTHAVAESLHAPRGYVRAVLTPATEQQARKAGGT